MTFIQRVCASFVLVLFPICARAGKVTTPTFGTSAPWTKIADAGARGWCPTYGGGFHNLAVSGSEVYVAYAANDTLHGDPTSGWGEVQIWVDRSPDAGVTWDHAALVARDTGYNGNGAMIAIGPDLSNPGGRRAHVVWGNWLTGQMMYASAPLDPSMGSFSAPVVVSGPLINVSSDERGVAADSAGHVHVIALGVDPNTSTRAVYDIRSDDGGATFAAPVSLITAQPDDVYGIAWPALATDPAGDLFVVTYGSGPVVTGGAPPRLYFTRALVGGSWSAPVTIPGIQGIGPSVTALDANHVYVVAGAIDNDSAVVVGATATGGTSAASWGITTVAITGPLYNRSIAVGPAGNVDVMWLTNPPGGYAPIVYVARSTDGAKTFSTPGQALIFTAQDDVFDANIGVDVFGKTMVDVSRNWTIVFAKEK